MIVDISDAFVGDYEKAESFSLDLSDLDFNGVRAISKPVEVEYKILSRAGVVSFDAGVRFEYSAPCDRCAADAKKVYSFTVSRTLVREFAGDSIDEDRFVLVEDGKFDIDELINSEVVLSLPSKFLCKKDCKGLCPQCGTNLNEKDCSCEKKQVDPRLEALKAFLD